MTQKYFRYAFGLTGDKTAVPDGTQGDGSVSYQQGFGFDYQRAKADPLAKNIERDKYNQVLYDVTLSVKQYQEQGVPDFITAAENGGAAFAYPRGARVLHGGLVFRSLVAGNNVIPTSDLAKWRQETFTGGYYAVTVTGVLPVTVAGGLVVINAAGATTQTLPAANTFAPGEEVEFLNIGAGVATIQRGGADVIRMNTGVVNLLTLGPGDTLRIKSDAGGVWNAVGGTAQLGASSAFNSSQSANGYAKWPGPPGSPPNLLQWGNTSVADNSQNTVTLPIAFPTNIHALYASVANANAVAAGEFATAGAQKNGANLGSIFVNANTGPTTSVTQTVYWWAIGN